MERSYYGRELRPHEVAKESCQPAPVTVLPGNVDVKVGNLEIRLASPEDWPAGQFLAGHDVEILLDGKPVAVKSLTLKIAVDEVVRCEMEFLPATVAKKE